MNSKNNKDVIKLMLNKAHEKLTTAEIDFNNERFDDSISRAYYAVFHAISALLLSKGMHYSSHAQVIGSFNREFVKTKIFPKTFTRIIQRLFEERQIGDYDIESEITFKDAQKNLSDARKIINAIGEFLT